MNIGLVYATMTGHSRKIATAIGKELNVEAQDIKKNPKLENIDVLFIVGGVYGGKSSPELVEFVNKLDSSHIKKVFLITSSAGVDSLQKDIREALGQKGIQVATEEYKCRGSFLFFGMGHPNKDEISNAVSFAKKQVG